MKLLLRIVGQQAAAAAAALGAAVAAAASPVNWFEKRRGRWKTAKMV